MGTENINQSYCVVATDRRTKRRVDMTGAITLASAQAKVILFNANALQIKKSFTYFKIAKHPYRGK